MIDKRGKDKVLHQLGVLNSFNLDSKTLFLLNGRATKRGFTENKGCKNDVSTGAEVEIV